MRSARPRVFFLSCYPPMPTMGGAMTFHRHFVERKDFELFVATTSERLLEYNPQFPVLQFQQPRWLARLCRTRLGVWAHSFSHLFGGYYIPNRVWQAARSFRPDLIFTMAGSWDCTTFMCKRLARSLRVPLVGSFNDWFDYGIILHPALRQNLEKRFRGFYADCDLAWCTSEGMREELGPHHNAQILYPIGGTAISEDSPKDLSKDSSSFVVAFAGNLGEWYGQMLERLVSTAILIGAPIEFRIYGGNQSWSKEFDNMAREKNIFRGHVPFKKLREELAASDLLLLPMGFAPECAQVERTSFKTKFLDYLLMRKPILVWGPEYCSAVRVAREFDSAEICSSPDHSECLSKILVLRNHRIRRDALMQNALKMFNDRFNPDRIHSGFVSHMRQLLNRG